MQSYPARQGANYGSRRTQCSEIGRIRSMTRSDTERQMPRSGGLAALRLCQTRFRELRSSAVETDRKIRVSARSVQCQFDFFWQICSCGSFESERVATHVRSIYRCPRKG
ncbi:hypothetical protein LX32DRAFT_347418 [Colletotrichum zoysiae]|uniref:Uncharacterized protein n=1 Tax=Colletotrichum zoysiae TaxID=1216348 RepID=A0AAD9HJ25_9PEZI|nr:hypothetical protein LX32DRAFT_347418 [Colletotrichum zoysiae]